MVIGVLPVIVIVVVIVIVIVRASIIVIYVLDPSDDPEMWKVELSLEMNCKVHESYALVLQLRRLHLSCALDLVEKFNWEGKREK